MIDGTANISTLNGQLALTLSLCRSRQQRMSHHMMALPTSPPEPSGRVQVPPHLYRVVGGPNLAPPPQVMHPQLINPSSNTTNPPTQRKESLYHRTSRTTSSRIVQRKLSIVHSRKWRAQTKAFYLTHPFNNTQTIQILHTRTISISTRDTPKTMVKQATDPRSSIRATRMMKE